mgnify:CR=1 FL=1
MGVRIREKPKGSGNYYIYIHHEGRRKSVKVGKDRKMAEQICRQIEARLVLGKLSMDEACKTNDSPTFMEYAKSWLDFIRKRRKEATYVRYKGLLDNYVLPAIGKMRLDEIRRSDLKKLLMSIHKKGLSDTTVRLCKDVINGPLTHAMDEELIATNPCQGITKTLGLEVKKNQPYDFMDHAEANHFLAVCEQSFPEDYPFFLCALRTGMRLGELLALEWSDIDFTGQFIQVSKSYKVGKVGTTKTGKTRRVDMSDRLATVLQRLLTLRKTAGLRKGKSPCSVVFSYKNGYMPQNQIRRIFHRALSKAKLRHMRLHSLRHSFASHLLSNGISPVYVKEQLGHHSIQMTVDRYGHLIPSSNRDAVNQLDQPTQNQAERQPQSNDAS